MNRAIHRMAYSKKIPVINIFRESSSTTMNYHGPWSNWGEFRAQRTAGDYADYGEEIQISHFRISNSK